MDMRRVRNFIMLLTGLLTAVSASSISIDPDSLFESLNYGDTAIHSVTITNNDSIDSDISIYMVQQFIMDSSRADRIENFNEYEIGVDRRTCGTVTPSPTVLASVQEELDRFKANGPIQRDIVNVQVAFHVIHSLSGNGNISDLMIHNQINVLNEAYEQYNIIFTLSSIDRTANDNWFSDMESYEQQYKQQLNIDPTHHLNIYTGDMPGLLGWSYMPYSWTESYYMHGVCLSYTCLPGGTYPYNLGRTASHEVGHYLGLLHTFENGCNAPGDYVNDTPYQDDGNNIYTCNPNLDTCPNQLGIDPVHNYMNYVDDACLTEFTNGQSERMDEMISQYRPSLLDNPVAPSWLMTPTLDLTVPANSSIAIDFTFDATNTYGGDYYTAINYSSVAADTTIEGYATLQIIGDPEIESSTSSINFGGVYVNDTTSMQLFLSNTGTDDLMISSIVSDPEVFFTVPNTGVIDPEESMNVTVYFLPTVLGDYTGSVTVYSNDADDSVFVIPVYGEGLVSPMQFSVAAISDTMAPNDLHIHRLALTNSGNFILDYSISHDIPWITLSHNEGQLDAGSEDSVSVTINTLFMGYGDYEGTLVFTTNVGEFILPIHLVITMLGVDDDPVIPSIFSVSENYPNPFNPRTEFTISIPERSHVVVNIYNILGRKVASLAEGEYTAGRYRMEWAGKTDVNAVAPSGVYLLVVQAGNDMITHKMIMMK